VRKIEKIRITKEIWSTRKGGVQWTQPPYDPATRTNGKEPRSPIRQNWKCFRLGLIEPVNGRYCQVQKIWQTRSTRKYDKQDQQGKILERRRSMNATPIRPSEQEPVARSPDGPQTKAGQSTRQELGQVNHQMKQFVTD
jgi:hypothetical protein